MTPERLAELRKIAEAATPGKRVWQRDTPDMVPRIENEDGDQKRLWWTIDDERSAAAFDRETSLALVAAAEECHRLKSLLAVSNEEVLASVEGVAAKLNHGLEAVGRAALQPEIDRLATENAKLAAERDDLAKACKMVLQRWTFDNNQHHTHNWHAMADCFEVIHAALGGSS